MNRRKLIQHLAAAMPAMLAGSRISAAAGFLNTGGPVPIADGPFRPDWQSLQAYRAPEWFRDAKFGIWAHWGPQCQPEHGDWYARSMYDEGSDNYKYHVEKYGHPSKAGFKDVIREFKAENWDPDELVGLYKNAGAEYFMALANHHDNFDLFKSSHQPWNSVNLGPKKDIVGGWAKAARKHGLRFGVSVHAAHAWTWYETAQRSDKNGPLAGVPYDGKLTKADGKGTWWEGYDPQDLYAQDHDLSVNSANTSTIHSQWNWGNGANVPTAAYCNKFLNRTIELIDRYEPDLVYFDDTALPLWPISDAGLKIAAHFYNRSAKKHGKVNVVIYGKILDAEQRKCMVWDIERGQSNNIESLPWQTDTCIGSWHYDRRIFDRHRYKSAKTVIHTLADVVSKNGNLLLSVPVRGDGTIDSDERKVVQDITAWMRIHKEAIAGTRPWTVFGEGPAMGAAVPLSAQGFNEGKGKPFTAQDIRFTCKGDTLFATSLGVPGPGLTVTSLAVNAPALRGRPIRNVRLLGYGNIGWKQTAQGLELALPDNMPSDIAAVFAIEGAG